MFAGGRAFKIPERVRPLGPGKNRPRQSPSRTARHQSTPYGPAARHSAVHPPVNGAATLYVVGTDGELHGFATPRQFLSDGYDPALVVTVPSLSGLTIGASAGSEGATANALATVADGTIVVSSRAYYVFAGGRAFEVPTAKLAAVRRGDKAQVLPGPVSSSLTSRQPRRRHPPQRIGNGLCQLPRPTVHLQVRSHSSSATATAARQPSRCQVQQACPS